MFRSFVMARMTKRAFENATERKNTIEGIQKIIRNSLTEFDRGAEEYRVFRETHDTPDWGVVRMSSIAMAHKKIEDAELFLKQQMEEYGGAERRQARNVDVTDEQICASIERVIYQRNGETSEYAFQFFDFLRKYKFCTTRDVFVRVLIGHTAEKHGWRKALERLQLIVKEDKRAKSMKISIFFILENALKTNELDEAEKLVSQLENLKPSTLQSIQLFLRLNEWQRLEVADYCRRNSITLNHEDIMFIVKMSGKLKYPMPLLRLLEIQQFIRIPRTSIFPIFDELIKLAGKSENSENLEGILWKVMKNRVLSDAEKSILYGKIRHFYKCLNVQPPQKLYFLMRAEYDN